MKKQFSMKKRGTGQEKIRLACQRIVLLAACALGVAAPGEASAQALHDPTRPPAQFLDPASTAEGGAPANSGLQTIMISKRRRVAMINGELVKAGDKVGEAVVERIGDSEVILKQSDGRREVLKLYPDVERRQTTMKVRGNKRPDVRRETQKQ